MRGVGFRRRGLMRVLATLSCIGLATSSCSYLKPPSIDPHRVGDFSVTSPDGTSAPALNLTSSGSKFADTLRGDLTGIPDTQHNFAAYMRASSTEPSDDGKATLFLQMGIALSDQLCEEWFEELGQAQVRNATARDFAGNLGALSAILSTVAGATPEAIGAIAAGTNFTQKTLDSEMANYIIAPDIGVVRQAIIAERAVASGSLTSGSLTFPVALQLLISYDNTCSHNEVKRIVNAAVLKRTDDTINKNTGVSDFYDALVKTAAIGLKGLFVAGATVDAATIEALYGLTMRAGDLTPAATEKFTQLLQTNKIYGATGKLQFKSGGGTDEQKTSQVKSVLTAVNALGDVDKTLAADNSLKPTTTAGSGANTASPAPAVAPAAGTPSPAPGAAPPPPPPPPPAPPQTPAPAPGATAPKAPNLKLMIPKAGVTQ